MLRANNHKTMLARFLMLMAVVLSLVACGSREPDQSSPESTIASARKLLEKRDAERLHLLIYSEDEEQAKLWRRLGRVLGHLEELSTELAKRYPAEVQELATRAQEAAAKGKTTSLAGLLAKEARKTSRRRGPPKRDEKSAFDDAIMRVFADPYAFLRESEGRLSTTYLNDDAVALLWDGKPVLPPLGMSMRQNDKGDWCFVMPTSAPVIAGFMPKTKDEYELAGQMLVVFDKVVIDLTKEVESGQHKSLEGVSRRAGEMLFLPAVLVFYAYQEQVSNRGK
jgi:hypothetical protein